MMPYLYNFLSSSDDEDIVIPNRKRIFKHRINYMEELDDIEFRMRFRLSKESVLLVLEHITEELEFLTNR